MRYHILLIVFVLIWVNSGVKAQLSGEINFNGGVSFPLDDLVRQDWPEPKSGFAQTGFDFGVNVSAFFKDRYGFGIGFYRNYYGVDEKPMEERAFEPGVDSMVEITSDDWLIRFAMLNLNYRYVINDKFSLEIIALIGRMSNDAPAVRVEALGINGSNVVLKRESERASSLALGLGAGLNYNLNDQYGFVFRTNYKTTRALYEYKSGTVEVERKISMLDFNAGVVYFF